MEKYLPLLMGMPLFREIPGEELPNLFAEWNQIIRTYSADDFLLTPGEITSHFGILLEGQLNIMKEDYTGNAVLLTRLDPGDLFAEAFAFAHLPVSVLVEAAQNAAVLWLDASLLSAVRPNTNVYQLQIQTRLLQIFARKNVFLTGRIDHLSRRTLRDKLLSYLYEQAQLSDSAYFTIPLNRQELADYLAADRSALSAVLGKLKKEGLIDYHKIQFTLKNQDSSQS